MLPVLGELQSSEPEGVGVLVRVVAGVDPDEFEPRKDWLPRVCFG